MTEVIVFPDAAAVVIDYLNGELPDPVTSRIPNPRPDEFVTVRRGGGTRQTLVSDAALLLIECWAERPEHAMDTAQLARGLVKAMEGLVHDGVVIYRVDDAGGPSDLPDPLSDQARVVLTMQVQMRGTPA